MDFLLREGILLPEERQIPVTKSEILSLSSIDVRTLLDTGIIEGKWIVFSIWVLYAVSA